MNAVTFDIEYVDKEGFHTLARGVTLTFPDTIATKPAPKTEHAKRALRSQRPDLFLKIPTFTKRGYTYRRGLCFTVVK